MVATLPIGDTTVTYPNEGLDPNQAQAVTHFLTQMSIVPKYSFRDDSFVGMFRVAPVNGEQFSISRSLGENNPRLVDKFGDRSFRADRTKHTRLTGRYKAYDLDFVIKDDTQVDSQIQLAQDILDRIQGAKARLPIIVALEALDGIPVAETAPGAANGLAFTVPANLYRDNIGADPDGQVKMDGNPRRWNMAKLTYARSRMRFSNVGAGVQMCALGSPLTMYGFNQDNDAVNSDYTTAMMSPLSQTQPGQYAIQGWGSIPWFEIPEMPAVSVDDLGVTRPTGNFKQTGTTIDEYILAKDSLLFLASPENQMFRVQIERDVKEHQLIFRFTAYVGAMVLNPLGVARVANLYNAGV